MKLSRRRLLEATIGLSQTAMLAGLSSSKARAQATSGPTKLLTVFMPGGWMSPMSFVSLSPTEIPALVPQRTTLNGEPVFFDPADVVNLDGTGDAPGLISKLRLPKLWNEAELSQGRPDPRIGTSPNGWSWKQHRLWENAMVVHGVDNRTVAHQGGMMSALTGIASSDFKAPSLQGWLADAFLDRYPHRPLPSVWIDGPIPRVLDLRPEASPNFVRQVGDLKFLYSNKLNRPWDKLKATDVGSRAKAVGFDGGSLSTDIILNPIEDRVSRRARDIAPLMNGASRDVLQQLHDGLVGVSRLLAFDVATKVEATRGVEFTQKPFWAPATGGHFAVSCPGLRSDPGSTWEPSFDLALRLLKADVCSSVALAGYAPARAGWDNGHGEGHLSQFIQVRAFVEVLGRLLGEMKATPAGNGRTLLDDTLVVLLSDFGRSWPADKVGCNHWQTGAVLFAGGGLSTNRMLGGYSILDPTMVGHMGRALQIRETTGTVTRLPRSADVVSTVLEVMGVTGVRIPGGNGEILGVRAGT